MVSAPSRLRSAATEATPPEAVRPPRRTSLTLAGGLLAALIGGLLFVGVLSGVDDRHEVLVVARPVAAGEAIAPADLRSVRVGAETGVGLVSASAKERLVGRAAAVPLLPGALLAPGQVGSGQALIAGEGAVGLALAPGRFPPGLQAGDRVTVVSAPSGPIPAQEQPTGLGEGVIESVEATVDGTGTLVRLRLPEETAIVVAAEGAASRLALVLVAPDPPK
jgi:hypothetical protein